MQPRIDLIYVDSGGGHRAAALALETVIREQERPWDVQLLSIQALLNSIDFIQKATGIEFQEVYNIMLRRGWTAGSAQLIPLMHLLIRMRHEAQVEVLTRHFRESPVDLVVSLIPHLNRALRQALARACPSAAYVTILTDLADYPPHFWIERQEQYFICGTEKAAQQARSIGIPPSRILRSSGMILHPRFHRPVEVDRAAERLRLKLDPHRPTGLVLFGGQGSMDSVRVAEALNRPGADLQLIFLCGRHDESAARIRAMRKHIPMWVEGFTQEVPYYMALSDFLIGKPGPGSISEALAMRLPVIVERNRKTLAHERYNAEWILERQVGLVTGSFDRVHGKVEELLRPEIYRRCRANAEGMQNRAVFEAVDWLEFVLRESGRLRSRTA